MDITLNLSLNNGAAALAIHCTSLEEFTSARNYLTREKILGNALPATAGEPTTAGVTGENQTQTAQQTTESATAPKRGRPAKNTAAATTAPAAQSAPATASETASSQAPETKPATIEDVTAALTEYAQAFGMQEALLLNQRFGVKKAGELKPEQYGDYVAFARDCLTKGTPGSAAQQEQAAGTDMTALV